MDNPELPFTQTLQDHIGIFKQLRDVMLGATFEPEILPKLIANELDIARVANGLNQQHELLEALTNCTTLAVAAAHCEVQCGGRLSITLTTGTRIHSDELGATGLSVPLWLEALMAAIILRDTCAVSVLSNKQLLKKLLVSSTQAEGDKLLVGHEPFWQPYGEAIIALLSDDPQTQSHALNHVETSIQLIDQYTGVIDPICLQSVDRPLLELIAGFTLGDADKWLRTFKKALKVYQDYYHREENQRLLPGLLPLGLTALATLARDQEMILDVTIALVPIWLVLDQHNREAYVNQVVYYYPLKSIVTANEAHWFLDLQGFPRAGRKHTLLERQEQLVACYEAEAAPLIPKAVIEFVLLNSGEGSGKQLLAPLALDAGELLFLAESFANHSVEESNREGNRALLVDAINCINTILTGIAPGQDTVAPESILSAEGKALFNAEPGRFRRDRLVVYRDTLQSQLDTIVDAIVDGQVNQAGDVFNQRVAGTAIDVIRSQVEPIIKAIASDTSGQYVQRLKPKDTDYEQVFVGEAVALAREAYTALWNRGLKIQYPSSAQSNVRSYIAPAGLLVKDNPLARHFPQGYQAIAGWLNQHRVWVAWCYLQSGSTAGLNYDGLVFIDDRWVWFPKPYRVLSTLGVNT